MARYPVRGKLVGLRSAALYISVGVSTLHRWCQDSAPRIAFRKDVVGKYLFDTADLDDYLDSIYVPAGTGRAI